MKSSKEGIKQKMLNVMLMVNWGVGLEIVKTLVGRTDVKIHSIITKHDGGSSDKWFNVVYDYGVRQGVKTLDERSITFPRLRSVIQEEHIDLLIVHSFMRKLPKEVFAAPKYGSINIHASLLPKYRGPSTNYWVIKNREDVTGLTSHYINAEIDEGDIIYQVTVPVEADDTEASIIEKQKLRVGELMAETLRCLRDKNFKAIPQQNDLASYAPRPQNKRVSK